MEMKVNEVIEEEVGEGTPNTHTHTHTHTRIVNNTTLRISSFPPLINLNFLLVTSFMVIDAISYTQCTIYDTFTTNTMPNLLGKCLASISETSPNVSIDGT